MSARSLSDLAKELSAEPTADFSWKPHVFPKYPAPVLLIENEKRIIAPMSFGLIPFFEKEAKPKKVFHNARVESLHEKVTFKKAFAESRCLIPVDSFFEYIWEDEKKNWLARFYPKSNETLLAAGLWGKWKSPEGKVVSSFTMITSDPYDFILKTGHDRSPLFLERKAAEEWIAPGKKEPDELYDILKKRNEIDFTFDPITR